MNIKKSVTAGLFVLLFTAACSAPTQVTITSIPTSEAALSQPPGLSPSPTSLLPATPTFQPTPNLPTPTLSAWMDKKLEIVTAKDIPYTGERALDVYSPVQPGDYPIVVLLHGGNLTKTSLAGLGKALAQRGAVVFVPTYRSSQPNPPRDKVIGGAEDAACAVRFARAKAAEYGAGASERLILAGHSAGGAFGLTIMLAGDDFMGNCLVKGGSALPDVFVGLDGAYDLLPLITTSALEQAPLEEWQKITPITYLNRKPVREGVSFYLLAGSEEELHQMALRVQQALQAQGYSVYLALLPGVDHMSMGGAGNKQVLSVILEAVNRQ